MLSASFGELVGLARPDRSSPDPREASGWGRWRLKVTRLEVALPHLPPALDGFRMVQISDLHLEPFTKPKHILQVVAACTALAPDLVVMTGDFVTHSAHSIGLLAELLGPLQPPYGVHACLGNHDFWCDPVSVEKALQELNAKLDTKEGYFLKDAEGCEEPERKIEYKLVYREKENQPCAVILIYTRIRATPQYYCVPTPNASPELWSKFYKSLSAGTDNPGEQLQFFSMCLGRLMMGFATGKP